MSIRNLSANQYGAIILVGVIVSLFGILLYDVWYFVVSTMIGYLVADIIINFFIGGGKGVAQIPIFGHQAQHRGHAYIFYSIGIVMTTFISAAGTSYILSLAESSFPGDIFAIRIFVSFIVSVLVFADFFFRYYDER